MKNYQKQIEKLEFLSNALHEQAVALRYSLTHDRSSIFGTREEWEALEMIERASAYARTAMFRLTEHSDKAEAAKKVQP